MIQEFVESISGYPGLLGFCVVSGLLFPLPEDFTLVYAGVRISEGHFTWGPALATALVGVSVRDGAAYWLGRVLGDRLLGSAMVERWVGADKVERAEAMVRDHGVGAVLLGRFLIGFRAPLFAVAGASHVPFRQFVVWDGLGLLVTVPAVVWLGWFFGTPIEDGLRWVMFRAREVTLLLGMGSAAWWWVQARRRAGDAAR